MYSWVGRIGKDLAPYTTLAESWAITWNPPGWGSTTDVESLREAFGELLPGEWREALLVGLKPGSIIPLHVDAPYEQATTRIHAVLVTNPGCWNFHDGVWQRFKAGDLLAMDPTLEHASVNLGKTTRFHLVVDLLNPDSAG